MEWSSRKISDEEEGEFQEDDEKEKIEDDDQSVDHDLIDDGAAGVEKEIGDTKDWETDVDNVIATVDGKADMEKPVMQDSSSKNQGLSTKINEIVPSPNPNPSQVNDALATGKSKKKEGSMFSWKKPPSGV